MQFVWLNKQGVASDQGFVLQRVDRFAFEYREADHTMRLEGESTYSGLGGASFGFSLYANWRNATWQPPFATVPINQNDRDRIVQNIKEAMTFMGGTVVFA
jgi:hypothetical protein